MRNETPKVTFEQETLHLLAVVMTHKDGHRTWGGGAVDGIDEPLGSDELSRQLCPPLHITDEWRQAI